MSLCYDFQKWMIVSLASTAISLSIGLNSIAHGQTVDNQTTVNIANSSVDIPDNWAYEEQGPGVGLTVALTPRQFATLLINQSESFDEKLKDGGAYAKFNLDWVSIKNAPFDTYVEYYLNQNSAMNATSKQNVTIGNEPAVKIYADGIHPYNGIKFVLYLVWHYKEEPYVLEYMANVKDFEKYLPEFEQIVKSFWFIDKIK